MCRHFSPPVSLPDLPAQRGGRRQSGNRYALLLPPVKPTSAISDDREHISRQFVRAFSRALAVLREHAPASAAQGLMNHHIASGLLDKPDPALTSALRALLLPDDGDTPPSVPDIPPAAAACLRDADCAALGSETLALAHEHVVLRQNQGQRKQQGAFYTPAPLAALLCRIALADVTRSTAPDMEDLALWLEGGFSGQTLCAPSSLRALHERLLCLRVCDPAAGGGAFLAAMLQQLHMLVNLLEQALDAPKTPRPALLPCLHGVDVDEEALRCCRARLLLDAVAGDNAGEIDPQRMAGELLARIRSGDSLCEGNNPAHPGFSWDQTFPRGFDVFVGNPPFLRIQSLPPGQRTLLRRLFCTAKGKYDASGLFLEQALRRLRPNGVAAFVLPNRLFSAAHGQALLQHLTDRARTVWWRDLGKEPVFGATASYAALLAVSIAPGARHIALQDRAPQAPSGCSAHYGHNKSRRYLPLETVCASIFQGLISGKDALFYLQDHNATRESPHGPLRLVSCPGETKPRWLEEALLRPLLRGRDVQRYAPPRHDFLALYPYGEGRRRAGLLTPEFLGERAPLCWEYLQEKRAILSARGSAGMRYAAWYAYWCPRKPQDFAQPKLLVQTLALRAAFTCDASGGRHFTGGGNAGVYGLIPAPGILGEGPEALYYLLGLLNAPRLENMVRKSSCVFRGGYVSFGRRYIAHLPIALPRDRERGRIGSLAAEIMRSVENSSADCAEKELHKLVDQLYT